MNLPATSNCRFPNSIRALPALVKASLAANVTLKSCSRPGRLHRLCPGAQGPALPAHKRFFKQGKVAERNLCGAPTNHKLCLCICAATSTTKAANAQCSTSRCAPTAGCVAVVERRRVRPKPILIRIIVNAYPTEKARFWATFWTYGDLRKSRERSLAVWRHLANPNWADSETVTRLGADIGWVEEPGEKQRE